MKTIWKFETEITEHFLIKMPQAAKILCVKIDEKTNAPCIWAEVNPDAIYESRYFCLYGTGHEIPSELTLKYIGTYSLQNGAFFGHLFEKIQS